MQLFVVLIFGVVCITNVLCSLPVRKMVRENDFDDVRMDKKAYDKAHMIHYNWYLHSIKAIMGSLGKDLMKKLHRNDKLYFYKCLDQIRDRRDVVAAAQCLMDAKTAHDEKKGTFIRTSSETTETANEAPAFVVASSPITKTTDEKVRKVIGQEDQKVLDELSNIEKKKFKHPKRLQFKRRFKRNLQRLVADNVAKSDSFKYTVKNMDKMPSLKTVSKSGVQKVTNLIKTMIGTSNSTGWSASYRNLLELKKHMDQRAKDPGAKVYDFRMLDLVMDRSAPTNSLYDKTPLPPMIREAFDLLSAFENSPKGVSDTANIKFLSPRFAPLMPDKMEMRGKLSPSVLSFYNDDAEEQILPIPKLLEATGMNDKDRQDVLETVMEMSGARETVDDALKMLEKMNLFGMKGELKEVTERISGYFLDLENSFTKKQKKEMKKNGFTYMDGKQIDHMYQKQGISDRKDEGILDVEEYKKLNRQEKEESLWLKIAEIAMNATDSHKRSKRFTLLSVLKPTVLAPYMFSPVYGLSILGPTVLSPSLFSPLILNPAVLSPYVFSPAVGMPFILSPYILSPYVLSPLVFAPFILNPYVVAPNVINPYVLSPLILSPLVLCPDVLSPMVLGGGILSPGVASPSVLSKSILMASVLSPSVLS